MGLFSLGKKKFPSKHCRFFSASDVLNIVCSINCIESFIYFFILNGKTLSTVLNNQLCNKKNYADIINLCFLILNKKKLYFEQKQKKCYINPIK